MQTVMLPDLAGELLLLSAQMDQITLHKIALNKDGNAIAIWRQNSGGGSFNIWADLYEVGTGWDAVSLQDSMVNKTYDGAGDPQIVIDANGNATAVW